VAALPLSMPSRAVYHAVEQFTFELLDFVQAGKRAVRLSYRPRPAPIDSRRAFSESVREKVFFHSTR
jgi:hypothetical protein